MFLATTITYRLQPLGQHYSIFERKLEICVAQGVEEERIRRNLGVEYWTTAL
jgi:hypothetical protein